MLASVLVLLAACAASPPAAEQGFGIAGPTGSPPIPDGWDPGGRDQIVTYSRVAADLLPIGVKVEYPGGEGISRGGSNGCEARPDGAEHYRQVLSSGDMTGGTVTIWYDMGAQGITMGWGRPDWGLDDVPTGCGSRH